MFSEHALSLDLGDPVEFGAYCASTENIKLEEILLVVYSLESVVPVLQHLCVHRGEGSDPCSIAKQAALLNRRHC